MPWLISTNDYPEETYDIGVADDEATAKATCEHHNAMLSGDTGDGKEWCYEEVVRLTEIVPERKVWVTIFYPDGSVERFTYAGESNTKDGSKWEESCGWIVARGASIVGESEADALARGMLKKGPPRRLKAEWDSQRGRLDDDEEVTP